MFLPVVHSFSFSPAVVTKIASQEFTRRLIWSQQCSFASGSQLMWTILTPGATLRISSIASFVT